MSRSSLTVGALALTIPLMLTSCGGSSVEPVAEAAPTTSMEPTIPSPETSAPVATSTTTTMPPVVDGDCEISSVLQIGVTSAEVLCLERHLGAAGWFTGDPDAEFDDETRVAVRDFQAKIDPVTGIIVDGIAGQQTVELLGLWVTPPPPDPDESTCEGIGDAAVIDREFQRAWLCADDAITHVFPITTAWDQPDPGDYEVEQKDREASSILTGSYSEMSNFVVFTYGKYQGARVGFHSVPIYPDGEYVQPLESVGTPELRGDSNGCIRALPDDAEMIWDHLDFGDVVRVIS